MSPRRLDPDVVRNKLAAIEATRDALRGAGPLDATRLVDDPLLCAAIERLLSRLVDLAVDVNSHVASARLERVATAVPLAVEVYGRYVGDVARSVLADAGQAGT